jgi:hypothetical protein
MSNTIKKTMKFASIKEDETAEITVDTEFLARIKLLLRGYISHMDEQKAQAALLYISGAFDAKVNNNPNPNDQKIIDEMEANADVANLHTMYAMIGFIEAAFMKKNAVTFEEKEIEMSQESADYINQLNGISSDSKS